MPIIFDEVTAEIVAPAQTTSVNDAADTSRRPPVDPQSMLRELSRAAERAERLNAD